MMNYYEIDVDYSVMLGTKKKIIYYLNIEYYRIPTFVCRVRTRNRVSFSA